METIGITLELIGTLLIAITVYRVHHHVLKEHKIDQYVLRQMKREQVMTIMGIGLIVAGFIAQISARI